MLKAWCIKKKKKEKERQRKTNFITLTTAFLEDITEGESEMYDFTNFYYLESSYSGLCSD